MLAILSVASLFVGVADLDLSSLFSGDSDQWLTILASRVPRLLAILCTGAGMSVAGLIMQQLTRNKFVSPTTGTTIASSELGILIAMLFFEDSTLMQRAGFAFLCALAGTWIYVWFIQNIRFQDTVMDRDSAIGTNGAKLAADIMDNEIVNSTTAAQNGHLVILEHQALRYTAEGGITALGIMISDLEAAMLSCISSHHKDHMASAVLQVPFYGLTARVATNAGTWNSFSLPSRL